MTAGDLRGTALGVLTLWALALGAFTLAGCAEPANEDGGAAVGPHAPLAPPAGVLAVDRPAAGGRPAPRDPRAGEGAELYRIYCAFCHGPRGGGDGRLARRFPRMPDLRAPHVGRYTDDRLLRVVRRGGFRMPSYADVLSAAERRAVVAWVRALGDGDGPR